MSNPNLNLGFSLVGTVGATPAIAGQSVAQNLNLQAALQFLAGTGAGQADTVYEASVVLAASGTTTLALNGGGLLDPFGAAISLLHVKAVIFLASAANAGSVAIGNAATNGAQLGFSGLTAAWNLPAGEMFIATNGNGAVPNLGWVITAVTAMNLKLLNNSGAGGATVSVVVIGTST